LLLQVAYTYISILRLTVVPCRYFLFGRPIQRFWVLETVARIPYFAYISILHLYESLGFWRAGAELRKVHFAEEWNELHHLQVNRGGGGARQTVAAVCARSDATGLFEGRF
jgi:hypothetical protein